MTYTVGQIVFPSKKIIEEYPELVDCKSGLLIEKLCYSATQQLRIMVVDVDDKNISWALDKEDIMKENLTFEQKMLSFKERLFPIYQIPIGIIFRQNKKWYIKKKLLKCVELRTNKRKKISFSCKHNLAFVLSYHETQKILAT